MRFLERLASLVSPQMYSTIGGKKVLMVQTFADRAEWGGPSYHCVNPKRWLKRILKVYGSRRHPIPEPVARRCIEAAIARILRLTPDVLGLGGCGKTARTISAALQNAKFHGKIDYWGSDTGSDACEFLSRYGVDRSKW